MIDAIESVLSKHLSEPLGSKRKFSVMLPLIKQGDEWHILYEVRSKRISQPGETSFPGGAVEAGETFKEAAIRETMEELNISRDCIKVLGEINYIVNEHAIIHCFVSKLDLTVEEINFNQEVASLFTIPLNYFLTNRPTYYTSKFILEHPEDFPYHLIPNGKDYRFKVGGHLIPFYELNGHSLWGYTASLTDHFIDIITAKSEIM